MEFKFLELLSAAGDVGVWMLAYLFWRFDRRVIKLETMAGIK